MTENGLKSCSQQLWLDYFRQVQSAIDNIRLLEFQENIRATSKALGQTEIALTENPGSATLELSRKSLQKRLRVLKEDSEGYLE